MLSIYTFRSTQPDNSSVVRILPWLPIQAQLYCDKCLRRLEYGSDTVLLKRIHTSFTIPGILKPKSSRPGGIIPTKSWGCPLDLSGYGYIFKGEVDICTVGALGLRFRVECPSLGLYRRVQYVSRLSVELVRMQPYYSKVSPDF